MIEALHLPTEIYRKEVIVAKWSSTKTEDLFQIYWIWILSLICFCLHIILFAYYHSCASVWARKGRIRGCLQLTLCSQKGSRNLSYGTIWTPSIFFSKWCQKVGKQLHPWKQLLANFTPLAKRWFQGKKGQFHLTSINTLSPIM